MKLHFRPKTKVTCAYITELSYGSIANITFSAQRKFLARKRKIKRRKFIRPKTKKAENDQIAHFRRRK